MTALGCAGHFLPSDLRRPARSCKQVRRVADPSSQPHASRRIRCTRWPDEGSALEMADSDDDRSHSKGHERGSRCSRTLQRPCDRLAARQLAALVTGHAPCPVCGAHCTSVAQLPVTVTRQCSRGRPRTCRSPRVSRDAECTRSTATGCKRTPCGAVTSIRSHDVQMVPHAHATRRRLSGAQAAAAASHPHHMRIALIDPRLAGSPAGANRPAEAARS